MKKIFASILFIGILAFPAFSQEEIKTNQDSENIPEIYFENTIIGIVIIALVVFRKHHT